MAEGLRSGIRIKNNNLFITHEKKHYKSIKNGVKIIKYTQNMQNIQQQKILTIEHFLH